MRVDQSQGTTCRFLSDRRIDLHIELGEPAAGSARKLVRAQCGDEQGAAGHPGELHGGDPPAACGLLEAVGGVDDLARRGDMVHVDELHPLEMSDYRCAQGGSLSLR